MIKGYVQYDVNIFDDYANAYGTALGELTVEAGNAAFDEIKAPLLDELGYTPGRVKYPIEWTSERQRKAFFATDGFGAGIPYKRTGRAAKSWFVTNKTVPDGYRIEIGSNWKDAKFLYGTLNFRSLNKARKPMQKFHRNTGWIPASETVRFWLDAANEVFEKNFRNAISDYRVKRRSQS